MPDKTARLYASLAVFLAICVSAADVLLPQEIETDFLYTIPILLCVRTGMRWLPWAIAAMSAVWTIATVSYLAVETGKPLGVFAYATINDLFGLISVAVLAHFVSQRMAAETRLNGIIDFIDGRMQPADNTKLKTLR